MTTPDPNLAYLEQIRAWLDSIRGALDIQYLSAGNVQIAEGIATTPVNPDLPVRALQTDSQSGWDLKAWNATNPNTGERFRMPALLRIDQGAYWARASRTDQIRIEAETLAILRERGFTTYGGFGSGVQQHFVLKGVFDQDAPSAQDFDLDRSIGTRMPGLEKPSEAIKPDSPGKYFKRDKKDASGGSHFYAEYPEGLVDPWTVPIKGEGGVAALQYTTVDLRPAYMDDDGNFEKYGHNTTDGGGDISERSARRLYEAQTGLKWDRSIARVQILWEVKQVPIAGEMTGGIMKAMLTVIPDREYDAMKVRDGFDTDMRISSDGLANQQSNERVAHGRTIWHRASADPWEWGSSAGMTELPALERRFHMEELARIHFDHSVEEAFYAAEKAAGTAPSIAERIQQEYPRGVDEAGNLDLLDGEYLENVRGQQRIRQEFESNRAALATGSPYASPGALDTLAGGTGPRLSSNRRRGGGAPGLILPVFVGERTAAINLPSVEEPPPGMVRLVSRPLKGNDGKTRYSNHVVFNRFDMDDPEQLEAQSGPDNDDSYRGSIGKDKDGNIWAYERRSPLMPGGGTMYRVHPDDVARLTRQGMPIMALREDFIANGPTHPGMADFFDRGNGFAPEVWSENVQEIGSRMASSNPAIASQAKQELLTLMLGRGRIATMSVLAGVATLSGWIDTPTQWEEWAIRGDSLDVELFGTGHNERTAAALQDKIIARVVAGEQLDTRLLDGRPGAKAQLTGRYANEAVQAARVSNPNLSSRQMQRIRFQAIDTFTEMLRTQSRVLPKWQNVDDWIAATESAVKMIENSHAALANGPEEWLYARRRRTETTRGKYILPEVDAAGRAISQFWNKSYSDTSAKIRNEFLKRGLSEGTMSQRKVAARRELDAYYRTEMWQAIDAHVNEVTSQVRSLRGYRDGMLLASTTQHELIRRSLRNMSDIGEDKVYDHLRARIQQSFDVQEQAAFWTPGARTDATIVVQFDGRPWDRLNRSTGQITDTRRGGVGDAGWIRYEHTGHLPNGLYRLGPFASTSSETVANQLKSLADMGAEFQYAGNVAGQKGVGLFRVRFRQRADMQFTPAQMQAWMEARFHKGVSPDSIPPMWTSRADMERLFYDVRTPSGRPAVVGPVRIDYSDFQDVLTQPRFDFEDFTYAVDLPPHLQRDMPIEQEYLTGKQRRAFRSRKKRLRKRGGSRTADVEVTPVIAGEPELPEPSSEFDIPSRDISNAEVEEVLQEIKSKQRSLNNARAASQQQAAQGEPVYRASFKFDEPSRRPAMANRVGGRRDSVAVLVNLIDEMRNFYDDSGTITGFLRRGEFGKIGGPLRDAIWYSPTLGHFTTPRDVVRAYQDWAGWSQGKIPFLAAPGLRRAQTSAEAASLALTDLTMRAEERFWRNTEFGFMEREIGYDPVTGERVDFRWKHTRGKTHDLRKRVRPMMGLTIPTPIAGYTISPRIQYVGQRRHILERWISELEPAIMFNGDTELAARATVRQVETEYARIQTINERNRLKSWLADLYHKDTSNLTPFQKGGIKYAPGILGTVDELIDLGVDIKEVFRYTTGVLSTVEEGATEVMIRTMVRRGVEAALEKMDIQTLEPAAAILDRPELSPRMRSSILDSKLGQDYDSFRMVIRSARQQFDRGEWGKAASGVLSLRNLWTIQTLRRHNAIYTMSGGPDLTGRALGRIMPIAHEKIGDITATTLLDINALFDDKDINNIVNNIQYAAREGLWKVTRNINTQAHQAARRAQRAGEDFVTKHGIRSSLIRSVFEDGYKRESRERKKGGFNVRVIHKVRWYVGLTQGIGAKMLAGALKKKNVPMEKNWILNRRYDVDWACANNAGQGWIANNEEFRSGHNQPPAHPG